MNSISRPWPDFCSSSALIEDELSGVPFLVDADIFRARRAAKSFGSLVHGARARLIPYEKVHVVR